MQMIMIAGNIGKDPVLRNTPNGDAVLGFSVAVDQGKDKNGTKRESAWFDCSIWGKRATALQPYLAKGMKVTISGRPACRAHEGKAYMQVSVDELTMQGGGGDSQPNQGGSGGQSSGGYDGGNVPGYTDDEIPF
jgi:single-strand DNA-binding protein